MKPKHVAVIMDGNGRWAKERGLKRSDGHKEGLQVAKKITRAASDMGIDFLTLYVFSTENWKRAESEVGFLMSLIQKHLRAEFEFYKKNNIRVRHIGDFKNLPDGVQKEIKTVTSQTSDFTGTSVLLAINYGGRNELVRAVKKCDLNNISEKTISDALDTAGIPDIDLLIRTGGEKRLSNFLTWQSVYAELYFSDTLWPDWTEDDFKSAVYEFENRVRRFGDAK
ncbi:MAG: di-trans,poly-cis-decaprenylcistransferase [Treponema sp.]|nr:MAG: di-trans,poly-cis-decaprenylcistransferase [Treponema sp.]